MKVPWEWANKVIRLLEEILENTETIMSTGASEVALLNQLVTQLNTDFTAIQNAITTGDNPDLDAALANLQTTVGNFTGLANPTPPSTPAPPSGDV
jgi:hypothetical protein